MTDRVMNRGTDYAETEALLATLAGSVGCLTC